MTFCPRKKPFEQKAGFYPGLEEQIAFPWAELAGVCDQLVAMIKHSVIGEERVTLALMTAVFGCWGFF